MIDLPQAWGRELGSGAGRPRLVGVAVCLGVTLWLGCGGRSGPARYDIQGSVTYQGKPVPAGRLVFEPDAEKGNKGPASYADIKDGRYATPRGKGMVGGPHVVRITGTDGKASGESPQGSMLFPEFKTKADLPKEAAKKDFDVPAAARP